jgi:hypothetical protein
MWVERGDEHEGVFHHGLDFAFVCFDSYNAIFSEAACAVREEANRLEDVIDDDGFEHVEFEVAV